MTICRFKNKKTGEKLFVKANFSEASSPLMYSWDGQEYHGSPYQVADARHNPRVAAKLIARWCR
jgi:hypothetical protein